MEEKLSLFKKLSEANGVPGREKQIRYIMKEELADTAESFEQDRLGSLIAKHTGQENGPKIMLAAHMDEIGFLVHRIDDKGFVYFKTVGGWWGQVMLAQQVNITARSGKIVRGVIGSKPPHVLSAEARTKPVAIQDMYIDLGVTSKQEVEDLGIMPGDMITPHFEFTPMANPKFLLGKAWDNRIGVAITIDVMKRLKADGHPNVIFGVGTVQEEVGLRGAKTTANMVNPDIAFSLDVGIAGDTPGITANEATGELGKGPLLTIIDSATIGHHELFHLMVETAKEFDIPFQYDAMTGGGTDCGAMHIAHDGCPAISLGIATRYIHSHSGIIHADDYENTVRLIVEVVKKLDAETVNRITFM